MVKYIKCPRCELNYIDSEKQEYCDVCLAEMKGNTTRFDDFDDDDVDVFGEGEEQTELCPICGVNYIHAGEDMCETCRMTHMYNEEEVDIETDEEWKNYRDEDDDEDLTIDSETLDEELAQEEEEEQEDTFFDEDLESLDELADEEFDDDEDEDQDDDDLF